MKWFEAQAPAAPHRAALIILAATALAYCRSFSGPLVFDDVAAITNNSSIREWSTAFQPPIETTAAGRPFFNLTLAINHAISGNEVWSYHVTNLAIHILAGLTLFGVLRRTLTRVGIREGFAIAWCATLLWALHPLQTEAVTYIVQRAESLMGLLYLFTVYAFIRGTEADTRRPRIWFSLSFSACALGMATKEVMVSAPLLVLLYDRTFISGSFREALRRRGTVHGSLATTWVILLLLALSTHGRGASAGLGHGVSFWQYALTQPSAVLLYLKLALWPEPLVFYYGTQWVDRIGTIVPTALVVLALLGATGMAFFSEDKNARALGFAGSWFFAILAPSSLVPIVRQTAAEHRMYLSLIPVLTVLVIAAFRYLRRAALPLCLGWAMALLILTGRRNETYQSALRLWSDTVAKVPANGYAHYNLGYILETEAKRWDDAMAEYRDALQLMPDLAEAHHNLGQILIKKGQPAEALVHLQADLLHRPSSAEAHVNLGTALAQVPGGSTEAIRHFQEALRLNPSYAEAHYNLANALSKTPANLGEAIAEYEAVLRLKPNYPEAHNNLGAALCAVGRAPEALLEFETATRQKPNYSEARNNLGLVLEATGRGDEALIQFREGLRLDPDYIPTHFNLGNLLAVMPGKSAEAIAEYEWVLHRQPDFLAAHFNLAVVLLKSGGRIDDAIAHLEVVLRQDPTNESAKRLLGELRARRD